MSAVRLGDHAKLIRGITFKPVHKCDPRDEGAVVCMRTKNVQAMLDASDLIAVPSSLVRNPEKMLSAGDILVSSANSWNLVGKCCQVPRLQYPSTAGGFISILRPKTEKLESGYLYRWFSSDVVQRRLRSFANQTTNISNLDHKRTLELPLPLPPLAEQKRIAGILEAADALRDKRREALAELDTFLQSIFLDMFGDPVINPMGWKEHSIADCVSKCRTWNPKSSGAGSFDYIDLSSVDKDTKSIASTERYECSVAPSRARQLVEAHDVLVATVRPNLNGVALVQPAHHGMTASTGYCVLRPDKDKLDSKFLFHWVKTDVFVRRMVDLATGANYPAVSDRKVKASKISVPPLKYQRRFATIVEAVDNQKARQRAHLAELDTLFASLQSRAFRGDL